MEEGNKPSSITTKERKEIMLKYKIRKRWRHIKYKMLRVFYPEAELRRMIDIDMVDFKDAVKLTVVKSQRVLSQEEYDYFNKSDNLKYGLKYELARQMADVLVNHIDVYEIFDLDEDKHICTGEITIIKKKQPDNK